MLAGKLVNGLLPRAAPPSQPCTTPVCPAPAISSRLAPQGQQAACPHDGWHEEATVPRGRVRVAARRKAASPTPTEERPSQKDATELVDIRGRQIHPLNSAPLVLEKGAPEHPCPGLKQQTLKSSFTLGGVGLHTGDYAVVRVCPAFAGEGRYFVRVPDGTNEDRMNTDVVPQPIPVELEQGGQMPVEAELEEKKLALFKQYLIAQDMDGFDGTFQEYLHQLDAQDILRRYYAGQDLGDEGFPRPPAEEPQARDPEEVVLTASLDNIKSPCAITVSLGECESEEDTVVGVELLLAALEACGVDNARIEVEGGAELPHMDGSAQPWAIQIQAVGVRDAPAQDGSTEGVVREALLLKEAFTVNEGDAFVTFCPENTMRLTAGLDEHLVAPIIGKQWKSWCLYEDLPYRLDLAGARHYIPSRTYLKLLMAEGFYKGVTDGTVMLADGDNWYDSSMLRYVHDEAARHKLSVLMGVLALNAKPGHSGLPFGHVVAYKATPELLITFLRELQRRSKPSDWQPWWEVPLNSDDLQGLDEADEDEAGQEGEAEYDDVMDYEEVEEDEEEEEQEEEEEEEERPRRGGRSR